MPSWWSVVAVVVGGAIGPGAVVVVVVFGGCGYCGCECAAAAAATAAAATVLLLFLTLVNLCKADWLLPYSLSGYTEHWTYLGHFGTYRDQTWNDVGGANNAECIGKQNSFI